MSMTKVYDLTLNYLKNPIGIDSTPKFSYKLSADRRGEVQTARRIRVFSSEAAAKTGAADVWDSGVVHCSDSLHIPYAGKTLEPVTKYWWTVSACGADGQYATSEPAFFVTGKLNSRWNANWIAAEFLKREGDAFAAPYLRKSFTLDKPVAEAYLMICGLGYFVAYINGEKVGDDLLATPFTKYDQNDLYLGYDVTKQLTGGKNAIAAVLGNGWYNCFSEDPWSTKHTTWRHWPKMIAELHVTYTDGTKELIATRPDWKGTDGPIYFNGIRNGEHYDARKELGCWTCADYDDSEWPAAKIVRAPGGNLIACEMEPVRIHREIPAVKKWQSANGWVFDIGQNQAGVARFTFRGKAGTEYVMRYSDFLDAEGVNVDQKPISGFVRDFGFQTDKYIKKSDEPETWSPIFVYHGFQYVEITGLDYEPELSDVVGLNMYSGVDSIGEFSCSDEMLNRLQHLCWWSSVSNIVSIPTDCPHREKNGWTGDASVSSEQMMMNFGTRAFFNNWMREVRVSQRPAGVIPVVVPSTGWGYNSMNGPDWSSALVCIPWNLYTYNNDLSTLEANYEAIKKNCDYNVGMSADYTIHYGLGDWCAPFEGPAISVNMGSFKCPTAVTDTAYFYNLARTIVKMAKLLGHEEDIPYSSDLADKIKAAFRA
ncbi:MAG: family 78 glycoside hydrolase catalytic domain, partial [Clostridia bacterium]|nr:family 78 glycoside hydrolase catalytic domain [Clostridia bacterium]